jgi:hypothetical protein
MASNAFSAEVLADTPVGYWRLGEDAGNLTAADASGNGNAGTCSGAVTFGLPGLQPADIPGDSAASFDGASARVAVANSELLNPARITMECLLRWDGPTGFQQRILEKESFAGTTQYGLSVLPDGHVRVELRRRTAGSPDLMIAVSASAIVAGAGTHVAATYDGSDIRIYLDGVLDSTTTVNAAPVDIDVKWPHDPPDDPEVALAIGDRMAVLGGTHRTFNGLIDEAVVYAKALNPDRITAHYQAEVIMATTTNIDITAVDNELYVIAVPDNARESSEICHLKSGFGDPVSYAVRPQTILGEGRYTLVLVGINWGGPQAFTVTLTTGGVRQTYTAPGGTTVGAIWTEAISIIV